MVFQILLLGLICFGLGERLYLRIEIKCSYCIQFIKQAMGDCVSKPPAKGPDARDLPKATNVTSVPNPPGNNLPDYRFKPELLPPPVDKVDPLKIQGSNSSSGLPHIPGAIMSLADQQKIKPHADSQIPGLPHIPGAIVSLADQQKIKPHADSQIPGHQSHQNRQIDLVGHQDPPPTKEQEIPPALQQHQKPTSDISKQPHLSQLVHPNPMSDPSVMVDSVKDMDSAILQLGKTKMNSAIGFKARSEVSEISRTNRGLPIVREQSQIVNDQNFNHFTVPINLKLDIRVQ